MGSMPLLNPIELEESDGNDEGDEEEGGQLEESAC